MIKANFSAYSKYVTDSLYQWDQNRTLQVSGLNLTVKPEVHFSNSNIGGAIVVQADMVNRVMTVPIPNSLLQDPLRIQAHIGVYEGDEFKVVELVEIPVIPRKRPNDYALAADDFELYSFKRLENEIRNINDTWVNKNEEQVRAYVSVWLDEHPEATTTVQDGSISEAKLDNDLKAQFGKMLNATDIHNCDGFIQKIVDVCKTYTDNFDQLVYGNDHTAFDPSVERVDGKWQLDCSSFQNLLIRGVTFQNSKYAGNDTNVVDPMFFNKFDPYQHRVANAMARWLYDHGYTFEPAADFSNIEPGDLVFYSWPDTTGEFHENAFMHIDHVAMFLQRKNELYFQTIQFEKNTPNFFLDVDQEYMSSAVLVARLPFPMVENVGGNIVLDSHKVLALAQSNLYALGTYQLKKPMTPGKMYTACFTGKIESSGSYFVLQDTNGATLHSNWGETWSGEEKEYKFSFICPDNLADYSKVALICAQGDETTRTASAKNFCLYEGYKRTFTDSTIPADMAYPIHHWVSVTSDINNDIASGMAASSYVLEFEDYVLVNINLPLKTLRSGNLLLGNTGVNLSALRRLPANLVGNDNGVISHYGGFIQLLQNGDFYVNTWNSTQKYQYIMASGMIAK